MRKQVIEVMTLQEFQEKVFDYLEYLGYPEYVVTYEPEDVARAIHKCALNMFEFGESYRMTALACFGATMYYQVLRGVKEAIKH